MELTGTHLRYLLCMYEMDGGEDGLRLTQIAQELHVKKASAARIIGVFREKELVEQKPYGKVHLTAHGRETAETYKQQVDMISDSLQRALSLERKEAYDVACMLLPELPEHCIAKLAHTAE